MLYGIGGVVKDRVSRREALKRLGKTGAGAVLAGSVLRGQDGDIFVAGQPVEIIVRSVSPSTVRITVAPIESAALALTGDDALAGEDRWRMVASRRRAFGSIKAGNLVVRFTPNPPAIHIETSSGQS